MDTLGWLNLTPTLRDLDVWATIWSLNDDPVPHIRCKAYGNHQLLQNSTKEFPHTPDCIAQGVHSKLPWRDPLWIMRHVNRDVR